MFIYIRLFITIVFILHILSVSAYALSFPIQGKVQNSTETFTGSAIVHFSGDGSLTLLTNKGVICQGDFGYVTRREGRGTVVCQDGRKGYFGFSTAGFSGSGSGKIADENFDFQIGK